MNNNSLHEQVALALTLAELDDHTEERFQAAMTMADRVADAKARDEFFIHIVSVATRMRRFVDAAKAARQVQSVTERVHSYCEIAAAEGESGQEPSHALANAQGAVASLADRGEQIEAYCFIVVTMFLLKRPFIRILDLIQDAAESLEDPVQMAAADCQIASAKAQIGLIDEAEFRAERIVSSSYRDAAFCTIASEHARNGWFLKAEQSLAKINHPFFRDRALKSIAIAQAQAAAGLLAAE